jgi:hypothetical protein
MSQTISAQLDDETLKNLAKINPENRTEAIRVAAKGYLDGLDQDTPSWYFKQGGIEPEAVYRFLRSIRHSKEAGRYANGIYRKADDRTKAYIAEMCDPESPIYVKEIAESLKDQVELHDIRKEIEASRNALNKLKSEVTERTEEAEELAKKEEELTKRVNAMNEEISAYNREMYRIGTYRPIDALKQILDLLKLLGDNKLADRSEIITNYKVLNGVRKARDIAQSLWDRYNSFDSTKIGEIAERQKVEMVNEAEYTEDKSFRKHYKKLVEALQTIRQVDRGDEQMVATGNYYLFSYDFDRIVKEIAKLSEIMDGADGGRK